MTSAAQSVWPGGAPYALCLTHDVDRTAKQIYHYLYHGITGGSRGASTQMRSLRMRIGGRDPYWNFDDIMSLEDRLGVRSTVLFLNESARGLSPKFLGRYNIKSHRIRDIIRTLDSGGWEIGLHGSYFSYNDVNLLGAEKRTLEDILGKEVRSTRQHYLNLERPRSWQAQKEVGLQVDSTVGYADKPWDESEGILPYYPDGSEILEVPITLMDTIGLRDPSIRKNAETVVERIAGAGGLVVLDWHQRTYSPGEYSEAVELYTGIIRRARLQGAFIATMGGIADYWKSRGR